MVIARTTEGDVGILPNHAPMLSLMVHGVVDVTTAEGETVVAAVDAGFLSVANNRISILAEHAEMSARHRPREGPRRARARRGCRRRTTRRGQAPRPRGPRPGSGPPRARRPDPGSFASPSVGTDRGRRVGCRSGSGWSTPPGALLLLVLLYGLALVVRRRCSLATAARSSSASASGPRGPGAAGFSGSAATPASAWSGSGSSRWRRGPSASGTAPSSSYVGSGRRGREEYTLYAGHIVSCPHDARDRSSWR